ncbi:MBL fold metallo-hydrolase [Thalassotalea algicola]|uniref:MBL fold metallo-hydrolase n=1 Tax=Thalassotalea algicola TaxID=2716224 RepID=UPI001B7D4A53|nr:MBL fold metallo-hydrolase [Thalassotalea algicola]
MKKLSSILLLSLFSFQAICDRYADVEIKVTQVAGQVYMLKGAGGNIGVLATQKGLMLVDDQFEPLAEKIEQAMKSIVDKDLKYVVNTHYHGDHTGSNSYFSHKAPIFAHNNVRKRLASNDKLTSDALPVVTYEQGVTIHLEQETVQLTHLPSGHTDSDTVVYFKNANVLHTGDLFFELGFPYVDTKGGGTVDGYLANVEYMIANYPDNVAIIPGHGKLTDKASLKQFADMIRECIKLVTEQLAVGKSEEEILTQGVAEKYKHLSWHFITEERWLKTLIKAYQ